MNFLDKALWARAKAQFYCHDAVSCTKYESSHPISFARRTTEHVGAVYDAFGVPRAGDAEIVAKTPRDAGCEPAPRVAVTPRQAHSVLMPNYAVL